MPLPSDPPTVPAGRSRLRAVARGTGIVLARARFLLVVGFVLLLVGTWPTLQVYWGTITRPAPPAAAVSRDTEYWCPMCPGVVSDWPSKCPVCHMTLVRRQKGEMTPLPDGVVARVQLSPYRIQLAGIRTVPAEYRRLEHEVIIAGRLEPVTAGQGSGAGAARLVLEGEVLDREAPLLAPGQEAEVSCDALPGETFSGRVAEVRPAAPPAWGCRVRLLVDGPQVPLSPGTYATARFRRLAVRLTPGPRLAVEAWRDRTAAELFASALGSPAGPLVPSALPALVEAGADAALRGEGFVLAVPEASVIDTGTRKVVYVERMRGMFDAVEVRLGRRCGDFYPVRSGLIPGEQIVTAGAVLLDAETRLNPNVAATYFGAGARTGGTAAPAAPAPSPGSLSPEDRLIVQRQKVCPVSGAPLDSMGGPVAVTINGRKVFICCDGCEESLRESPGKYLPKLPR